MPQVSRIPLGKKVEKQLLKTLHIILSKVHQEEDMSLLLASMLTSTEQLMLAKRLGIIILLEEGISDTDIAASLHVTRITVSRLRYFYESRGEGYKVALQVLRNEEVRKFLKESLLEILQYTARAAGGRVKPSIF